jgi:hypothetical protein
MKRAQTLLRHSGAARRAEPGIQMQAQNPLLDSRFARWRSRPGMRGAGA